MATNPHRAHRAHVLGGQLRDVEDGTRVRTASVVTHLQRPVTASGVTFMNLEDETGMINVVISVGCWNKYARIARESNALIIRGRIERAKGVVKLVAARLERLPFVATTSSRDFHHRPCLLAPTCQTNPVDIRPRSARERRCRRGYLSACPL